MSDSESKKKSHLTLVVSNPALASASAEEDDTLEDERPTEGFSVEIQDSGMIKGVQVYHMVARDPSHYLGCTLKLEIIENPDDYGIGVICHFPKIPDKKFNKFISYDETLYAILMIQFQMSLMEELLLFCGDHHASGLVMYVNDDQAKLLGAYDCLLLHHDQVLLEGLGERTAMVISVDCEAFDKWVEFMEHTSHCLHQALWAEQKNNPIVRAYIKSQQADR